MEAQVSPLTCAFVVSEVERPVPGAEACDRLGDTMGTVAL